MKRIFFMVRVFKFTPKLNNKTIHSEIVLLNLHLFIKINKRIDSGIAQSEEYPVKEILKNKPLFRLAKLELKQKLLLNAIFKNCYRLS